MSNFTSFQGLASKTHNHVRLTRTPSLPSSSSASSSDLAVAAAVQRARHTLSLVPLALCSRDAQHPHHWHHRCPNRSPPPSPNPLPCPSTPPSPIAAPRRRSTTASPYLTRPWISRRSLLSSSASAPSSFPSPRTRSSSVTSRRKSDSSPNGLSFPSSNATRPFSRSPVVPPPARRSLSLSPTKPSRSHSRKPELEISWSPFWSGISGSC